MHSGLRFPKIVLPTMSPEGGFLKREAALGSGQPKRIYSTKALKIHMTKPDGIDVVMKYRKVANGWKIALLLVHMYS